MRTLRQCGRLIYIYHVFAKNGLDTVLVSIPLFRAFRIFSLLNPWNWFRKHPVSRGQALRSALEELGPIFIKFGQAMSTRPDILPEDIAEALNQLQDNVPAFASEVAVNKIQHLLGASVETLFSHFDHLPLASASIAQVHAATLKNGRSVVVKVVRPGIRKQIQRDLSLMKRMALVIEHYRKDMRRFRLLALVEEFEGHLLDELDLQREGANAAQLRRNFMRSPLLYVPEIIWEYTRQEVLVMERIEGIPVADKVRLEAAGVNFSKLASRGVEIFFTQVFRDSFFHADMHPGNIFVSPHHPDSPSYICVDFVVMGSLSDEDQRYLAYNLYAFFTRDYRRVAQLHIESGWVAKGTRVEVFESAIRTVCEPIFERPLHEISFAKLVLHLLMVAKQFQMEVQPQLMLLQKTLLAVEGLGRQLYPELDLWVTAKPLLERWLKARFGPKVFLTSFQNSNGKTNMSCLFCNIANGTIPVKLIYEDDRVMAFQDINPQAPTHLLIIPRQHIENINHIEPEHAQLLAHLLFTAKHLAKTLGLNDDGYRLVINTNEHGGQTVYHLHFHFLGGRKLTWPPG